ncbi:hypothetical protein FRB96_003398 [Tulasnella sp. 330]|nr:hypothetical protein FRB96_003398 [Tulasnella sp. 330]
MQLRKVLRAIVLHSSYNELMNNLNALKAKNLYLGQMNGELNNRGQGRESQGTLVQRDDRECSMGAFKASQEIEALKAKNLTLCQSNGKLNGKNQNFDSESHQLDRDAREPLEASFSGMRQDLDISSLKLGALEKKVNLLEPVPLVQSAVVEKAERDVKFSKEKEDTIRKALKAEAAKTRKLKAGLVQADTAKDKADEEAALADGRRESAIADYKFEKSILEFQMEELNEMDITMNEARNETA